MTDKKLNHIERECGLCVVGGGLAGTFAAVAAARRGIKTVLIQDRPVLGGNCSSEIRMWIRGATQQYRKETGLISEFEQRNIYYNPTLSASVSDAVLYSMAEENPLIELFLNCSVMDARTENGKIICVTGWQTTTYTFVTVRAKIFADCSGDSILAPLTGALVTSGREAAEKYGESLGVREADCKTMGMSIILSARDAGMPVKFTPPPFANVYPDDDAFDGRVTHTGFTLRRSHDIKANDNLWWIELGGEKGDICCTGETGRELLACVYGVWDHIKNRGDHGMENYDLEWVGFLPGKRESRRYIGDYVLTQRDVEKGGRFYDAVAYGGWPMDDHDPAGMKDNGAAASQQIYLKEIYGIPYRCIYSANIDNLMFAGRNISVSHVALTSSRVMGTCALLGQALGEAAALALENGMSPRGVLGKVSELRQRILEGGAYLPGAVKRQSALTKTARTNLSSEDAAVLFGGVERPLSGYGENDIKVKKGERLVFEWEEKKCVRGVRMVFDEGWDREWLPGKLKKFATRLHRFADDLPVEVYPGMIKGFCIYADGEKVFEEKDNFLALRNIPLGVTAKRVVIEWTQMRKGETASLFAAEVY